MSEIKELAKKIEEMRTYLNDLIAKKENLIDKEIVQASQDLDKALNDYNEILTRKEK